MTAAKRVVMNTGILYAGMVIKVLLSLYTTRLVLDALGVEDFGIFNLVGGVIAMLTFLSASMAGATQRFMSFAQGQGVVDRQHQIFNVSIVLHTGVAVLLVAIFEIAGAILFGDVLKIAPERMHTAWLVYQFAVVSTFFTIVGVPYDAVINARENMLLYALLGIVESILKFVIALVLVNATTDKLALYGLFMAIISICLLMMRVVYCIRRYPECELAPRHYFNRIIFKEMTIFAGWSLLGSATSMITSYGQIPVMNTFFGTAVNAAQGISNQISGQLSVLSGTMQRALNPLIAKCAGASDRALMLKATIMGSKFGFFLLMLIYVPVMVEMPYVFSIWLPVVPDYVITFCILQLIRNLIEQFFIALASSIFATGDIKNYQLITSFLSIFPLLITVVLFKMGFEPSAMYYVFMLYSLGIVGITIHYGKKYCNLSVNSYLKDAVLRCLGAFFIVICASSLPLVIMQSGFTRFVIVVTISLFTFLSSVWWVGLTSEERVAILGLLDQMKFRINDK